MAITEGPITSKLCILTDFPRVSARANGVPLFGWDRTVIDQCLLAAGIHPDEVLFESVLQETAPNRQIYQVPYEKKFAAAESCLKRLNSYPNLNVIIPLGEFSMATITGKKGVDKWHMSIIPTREELTCEKAIPTYGPDRWATQFHLQVYIKMAFKKAKEQKEFPELKKREKNFLLNPCIEETIAILENEVRNAEINSVDIETGRGQINTVGFAWDIDNAIAINVLPDRFGKNTSYKLWSLIGDILKSDQKKVLQNAIYEHQYFSLYGLRMENVHHDTMWAQKFIWPELKMGLDEVGRIHTSLPYWKDDGKSWNNVRDWELHYKYNCTDTTGTLEGMFGQITTMKERGIYSLFTDYIMKLYEPVAEMCARGLPLNEQVLFKLREEVSAEIAILTKEFQGTPGAEKVSTTSPMQIKKYYTDKGYQIPKKYDGKTKTWKESTDEKSLKKLRIKHPKDGTLSLLIKLSRLNKASSSYLNFGYDSDKRMRFSMKGVGTETFRMASGTDVRDNGMNAQTVPGGYKGINIKKIFQVGEGRLFLQCDLMQAESRFVAYDCADSNLITMLEDPNQDVHSYVAAEIFNCTPEEVMAEAKAGNKYKRQLGKKSGHGANYDMKGGTFVDSALQEMDVVLTKKEADNILESYHRVFPGIRQGHAAIREEVRRHRLLKNPLGMQRQFFGRMDDNLFREAYPFRPQSTIPAITNYLMLYLCAQRRAGRIDFELLLQVHDSVLLDVPEKDFEEIAGICLETDEWHPEIILKAGRLIIPTSIDRGTSWGEVEEWTRN